MLINCQRVLRRMTPSQEYILLTLKDERFNIAAVCKHAGLSYKKLCPYIQGNRKKPLEEEELKRLWESMQILEKEANY